MYRNNRASSAPQSRPMQGSMATSGLDDAYAMMDLSIPAPASSTSRLGSNSVVKSDLALRKEERERSLRNQAEASARDRQRLSNRVNSAPLFRDSPKRREPEIESLEAFLNESDSESEAPSEKSEPSSPPFLQNQANTRKRVVARGGPRPSAEVEEESSAEPSQVPVPPPRPIMRRMGSSARRSSSPPPANLAAAQAMMAAAAKNNSKWVAPSPSPVRDDSRSKSESSSINTQPDEKPMGALLGVSSLKDLMNPPAETSVESTPRVPLARTPPSGALPKVSVSNPPSAEHSAPSSARYPYKGNTESQNPISSVASKFGLFSVADLMADDKPVVNETSEKKHSPSRSRSRMDDDAYSEDFDSESEQGDPPSPIAAAISTPPPPVEQSSPIQSPPLVNPAQEFVNRTNEMFERHELRKFDVNIKTPAKGWPQPEQKEAATEPQQQYAPPPMQQQQQHPTMQQQPPYMAPQMMPQMMHPQHMYGYQMMPPMMYPPPYAMPPMSGPDPPRAYIEKHMSGISDRYSSVFKVAHEKEGMKSIGIQAAPPVDAEVQCDLQTLPNQFPISWHPMQNPMLMFQQQQQQQNMMGFAPPPRAQQYRDFYTHDHIAAAESRTNQKIDEVFMQEITVLKSKLTKQRLDLEAGQRDLHNRVIDL